MSGLVQALIDAEGLVEFPDAGAARVAVGLAAVATHAGSLAGLARVRDSGFAQAARFMNVEGGAQRHVTSNDSFGNLVATSWREAMSA